MKTKEDYKIITDRIEPEITQIEPQGMYQLNNIRIGKRYVISQEQGEEPKIEKQPDNDTTSL